MNNRNPLKIKGRTEEERKREEEKRRKREKKRKERGYFFGTVVYFTAPSQ
jgi:hypothetical protein